ncbi:MAG: CYTH domain-containing protein [Calditrichaceae bacterium]
MGVEIERKFLVKNDSWRRETRPGKKYRQGYLSTDPDKTIRVRVAGVKAFITIKGRNIGLTRGEFEYEIPKTDAEEILRTLCKDSILEKTRYSVEHDGMEWSIDEFEGNNQGLIMAEIELHDENQFIKFPRWIGEEVSTDIRYYNSNLVHNPYKNWK